MLLYAMRLPTVVVLCLCAFQAMASPEWLKGDWVLDVESTIEAKCDDVSTRQKCGHTWVNILEKVDPIGWTIFGNSLIFRDGDSLHNPMPVSVQVIDDSMVEMRNKQHRLDLVFFRVSEGMCVLHNIQTTQSRQHLVDCFVKRDGI